jgi:hypothetical protein
MSEKSIMVEEKLYKASQWKEAQRAHRMNNPEKGDYWWEDHFCPVLVVLALVPGHVVICDTKQDADDNKWCWDLTKITLVTKKAFIEKLEFGGARLSDSKMLKTVEEFEKMYSSATIAAVLDS